MLYPKEKHRFWYVQCTDVPPLPLPQPGGRMRHALPDHTTREQGPGAHLRRVFSLGAGLLPAGGVPGVALLALVALPGTAIKQMINVVQMRAAMALLVLHDRRKERR